MMWRQKTPLLSLHSRQIVEELAVVTSSLKPMVMAVGSSETASHVDPELAEFEAMDLEAQLLKIEELGETLSKAKSKVVDEAMDRIRIW
ncbi:unnamed protein product [Prunus armeniaca]